MAVLLGLVAVGVIGMHLLSSGHQLATTASSHISADGQHHHATTTAIEMTSADGVLIAHDGTGTAAPSTATITVATANVPLRSPLSALTATIAQIARTVSHTAATAIHSAVTSDGDDDGCGAGCGHSGMLLGACLLAFTFGAVCLLAGRSSVRALFRIAMKTPRTTPGGDATAIAPRRVALTHRELSISRT